MTVPAFGRDEARSFLSALMPKTQSAPPRYFCLWDLATKLSSTFQVGDPSAIQTATDWSETPANLYIGVAMSAAPLAERRRLTNETAAGLYGLYLDIDISGPAHQKPNLPPSREAAVDLLDEFGVAPTVVVDSGHGLQPWWLFPQPWFFHSEADRAAAADLARGWVAAHRHVAAGHGWDHDAVGDLARVLRLPGTMNNKLTESPVPVSLIYDDGPRYSPSDLELLVENRSMTAPRGSLVALPRVCCTNW